MVLRAWSFYREQNGLIRPGSYNGRGIIHQGLSCGGTRFTNNFEEGNRRRPNNHTMICLIIPMPASFIQIAKAPVVRAVPQSKPISHGPIHSIRQHELTVSIGYRNMSVRFCSPPQLHPFILYPFEHPPKAKSVRQEVARILDLLQPPPGHSLRKGHSCFVRTSSFSGS